jgi:muramoyltetrapeptide carboxypeptidase
VFAPAGIPEPARLERGLTRLRGWGLEVVLACPGPTERFLSAPDGARAEAINELVRDLRVDLLLAARGGYGCGRLLNLVDFAALRARGIPLVGYSDITALHLAAFARGSCLDIAGPMVCSALSRQPVDEGEAGRLATVVESFRQVLAGEAWTVSAPLRTLREGTAAGPLLPANLSVLTSLVGTPFMPDLAGVILVLEDVGEAAYRVDRYLNQLRCAGHLRRLAGLVFGQFTEGDDARWLPGVLADFARQVEGPVVAGLEFGHGFPSLSLPVGRPCRLRATAAEAVLETAAAVARARGELGPGRGANVQVRRSVRGRARP